MRHPVGGSAGLCERAALPFLFARLTFDSFDRRERGREGDDHESIHRPVVDFDLSPALHESIPADQGSPPSSPSSPSHSRSSSPAHPPSCGWFPRRILGRINILFLSLFILPHQRLITDHRLSHSISWQVTTARGMAARAVHSNNHLVDEDSGGCGSGGGGLIAKANEHGRAAGADGVQIGLRLPTWGDRCGGGG